MQGISKKFVLFFIIIISKFCYAESGFNYRPITDKDINAVWNEWNNRDVSAKNIEVVLSDRESGFVLVKHELHGNAHFGGIILPKSKDLTNAPVMVILDGLNQEKPEIRLGIYPRSGYVKFEPYSDFIKIIPSFRGRTAYFKGRGYASGGDFCDAYDGATDDAIALVNVAESLYPEANFKKIFARGYSRGGIVALLMAVRDPRVNTVSSFAAPTDFYRDSVKDNYGTQYQCQFFEGKTNTEARIRMLASSPVYFKPQTNLENVDIHHGENDEVVPVWNAKIMSDHLRAFNINLNVSIYPQGKHDIYTDPSATVEKSRAGLYMFIESNYKQRFNNLKPTKQ